VVEFLIPDIISAVRTIFSLEAIYCADAHASNKEKMDLWAEI